MPTSPKYLKHLRLVIA